MELLIEAVQRTPIIDHHAHNLLLPDELSAHDMLSMTTEATGPALAHTPSTLAHLRAVKQLAQILSCKPTWDAVQKRIDEERSKPDDVWARKCFEGIETVLVDDGLDGNIVHPYEWHDRFTRSKCKKIVRIEKVAEEVIMITAAVFLRKYGGNSESIRATDLSHLVMKHFTAAMKNAVKNSEVVGFKSVICYRTGLAIGGRKDYQDANQLGSAWAAVLQQILRNEFTRLEDPILSPFFLHTAVELIRDSEGRRIKPLQFHTGLGDNDIALRFSSPSHLQPFIKEYPDLPIVLLHASYPFTREAGYLASVYENVYLDIGEVFPMISQEGQERVVSQALELCPSEKLTWSTDGHWFPETYLLAVLQVREALQQVLGEYIRRETLETVQAVQIVEDILFETSNRLYDLQLELLPLPSTSKVSGPPSVIPGKTSWPHNLACLTSFLDSNPDIDFIRLQWLDYTSTLRTRILTTTQALLLFSQGKSIALVSAVFGLLQTDVPTPGCGGPVGEYSLMPCFESLRRGPRNPSYAIVQCEFREKETMAPVSICPRTCLRNIVERAKAEKGIEFLVGYETEVVFMHYSTPASPEDFIQFGTSPVSHAHAWSATRALHNPKMMHCLEAIIVALKESNITLQQFHPESSLGQYEFVTTPLPPLAAVDALITTRDIIQNIASQFEMRATLHPKPVLTQPGSGQHIHLSMTQNGDEPAEAVYNNLYAGILKYARAICAITYPLPESYNRTGDGVWAGGRYVAWGSMNRETPLRKLEGSHWEVRFVDGFANSYLALAALLGAGLQGSDTMPKDCTDDPGTLSKAEIEALEIHELMPVSVEESWEALETSRGLRDVLGEELCEHFLKVKRHEGKWMGSVDGERRRNWLIERY
ncbi:hypothetical protein MMC26_007353 [Xylographa opegraphella]|nr:hypothetical protein [Xylographa opegraphella]